MKDFDCDVYLDLMPLVQDGAASQASRRAVEEHLKTCENCRRAFGQPVDDQEDRQEAATLKKIRRKFSLRMALAAVVLILLCAIPAVWVGIWYGNPLSEAIVRSQSLAYVEKQYPDRDFIVEEPEYHMKSTGYSVRVWSESSVDTDFELTFGYFGGSCWDGYEDYVVSGRNTFSRISEEVRELVEPALQDFESVSVSLSSDWPSIYDDFGYPFAGPERIVIAQLELDKAYDPLSMCEQYGRVEISTQVSHASVEEICRILTEIDQQLSSWGIRVAAVDVTVWDENSAVTVAGFPFMEISEADLPARVTAAAEAYEVFQAEFEAWIMEQNQ